MRAAVYQGNGIVSIEERGVPEIEAPDDVVIKVEANGLCGSDLRALMTPPQMAYNPGVVIGHEFAGCVVAVGDAVKCLSVDRRVVAIPNINCQVCWFCTTNRSNLCDNFVHIGSMRDGGAAEFVKVPERLVLGIPDGLSTELASLAEPLACILNGTVSASAQPGDSVVVFGAGPIGLLYMLVFKGAGATVFVSEPSAARRQAALDLGADVVIDPSEEDVAAVVRGKTEGRGADLAVETVGRLLGDAISVVRKNGRVLVFGLDELTRCEVSPAAIAYGEITIAGVYIAKGTFPTALRLLQENKLGFDRLLTHRLPLRDIGEAIELARRGEAIKVVVVP